MDEESNQQERNMFRNKTAKQHNFSVIPGTDVQRSRFLMKQTRKQAYNASDLVPIMCEEVLPGDTWTHRESLLARLATPIAPLVDDLDIETFYFFVPNRIVWPSWEDFITGVDPNLTIPTIEPNMTPGYTIGVNSLFDHFGLLPQTYEPGVMEVNVLPFWAYFTIWNEWFRDQNLQGEFEWPEDWVAELSTEITNTGGAWSGACIPVYKRHDYFTSSLPWPQKGPAVGISLSGNAPVITAAEHTTGAAAAAQFRSTTGVVPGAVVPLAVSGTGALNAATTSPGVLQFEMYPSNLWANLGAATSITINAIRLAITTQQLLEKDARGGSRYVESLLVHFGVRSPDYRLNRPEYLGGARVPVTVNPIAQTAAYDAEPGATPSAVGNLGAEMHASSSKHTFNYAATEHGYIIGLAVCRATPTYQQGTRRHWLRNTRLSYYFPVFGNLGEQQVDTREIYQTGNGAYGNSIFGYQERFAEYRYTPNEITGQLRSTVPQPMDWWHLSEEFAGEPGLNNAFIADQTVNVLARCLATAPTEQWSAQIIMDVLHESKVARLMPAYSVPGIDRF